jgi:hypothetical protein
MVQKGPDSRWLTSNTVIPARGPDLGFLGKEPSLNMPVEIGFNGIIVCGDGNVKLSVYGSACEKSVDNANSDLAFFPDKSWLVPEIGNRKQLGEHEI